jgi:outer membrane protein
MEELNPSPRNQLNKFKMNRVFISCILLFFSIVSQAQTTYTLQQCIDLALKNNIPVKQSELEAQRVKTRWNQSRSALLPNLTADASEYLFSGRSIDPSTNAFVNQKYDGGNYGANTEMPLFNGLSLRNTAKQNSFAYEASKMQYQQDQNELIINVILDYLSVLANEDQLQSVYRQAATTQATLDRLNVLNSQGAIKPSDVTDVKGQLMGSQLDILNAKNILETSKLTLAQRINIDYDSSMKLQRVDVDELLAANSTNPNEVYQSALNNFALVKVAELRKQSSYYGWKAAKGGLFPRLALGAGINTRYSSLAQSTSGSKMPYGDQLKNFKNSYVGVGLTVPIFNRFYSRNQIKLANIQLKDDELAEANTKRILRQQVDQAWLNMNNAYERYKLLLTQVGAYEESYKAAEIRFRAGVGTSVDYIIAKERLDRATISLVNAKYDFVLRQKILDYYSGKNQ